ncbi:SapC family protein [Desulfonatronum parangueonense]
MYIKPVLLNPKEHENLRLVRNNSFHFASKQMLIPIVYSEMSDTAREYPLVFLKDKPSIATLVGFENNVNAYVSSDGRWLSQYVPGRIRAYPFTLVQNTKNPRQYGVAVDMDSDLISVDHGEPLFFMGKPTQVLQEYMRQLEEMQKAEPLTQRLVQIIRDADLLVEKAIKVQKKDQENHQLTGLEFVDEKKLNQLPHEEFNKLRDSGALPLIYAHLLSFANLRMGVLKGQSTVLETENLGFVIGDDDMIKFQ